APGVRDRIAIATSNQPHRPSAWNAPRNCAPAQTRSQGYTEGGRRAMRVFVTGASGYAGFYAALRLAATGHTVTGIVRHPDQLRLNILWMQEVTLLTGDVCEPAAYRSELARSDVIIHTMLDKKRPFETDRALFGALQALSPRTPR